MEEFRSHFSDHDLGISDIRTPDINGYELAQHVKGIKPQVKTLLMSAFEFDSKYFANGLSHLDILGIIEKPISISELQAVVLFILNS